MSNTETENNTEIFKFNKFGLEFILNDNILSITDTRSENIPKEEIQVKNIFSDETNESIFNSLKNIYNDTKINEKDIRGIISDLLKEYKVWEKFVAKKQKDNKLSVKAKIIQFEDSFELFKDQNGAPCVRYIEDGKAKIYSILSKDFFEYISSLYYEKYNDVPTDQEIKSALSVFSVKAKKGEQHTLALRSCWYDNAIWHDLGDWTAVKITKDGWEIVQDVPKIFRHYNTYDTTVEDTSKISQNGNIKKLLEFVSLREDKQDILYLCQLCSAFIPDIQHPAISISGKPGSKKSTKGRIFVEFTDNRKGSGDTKNLIDFPDDPKELAKILSNHFSVCFDNISSISGKQSDVLSKFVTGANIEERQLYTNNETYSTSYKGTAALTAIDELFNKSDILERLTGYSQEKQSDLTRIDDDKFWRDFYEAKGEILGGIFNIISKAMIIKDDIKLERTPRMASFVKWGCAFSLVMGHSKEDFLEAYYISNGKLNEKLINSNLICSLIVKFIESKSSWEGTTSQLLLNLKAIAPQMGIDESAPGFPKDNVWLGRKINEFESNLKTYGIEFIETNKAKRIYKIINHKNIEKSSLFNDDLNLDHVNKPEQPKQPWERWSCFDRITGEYNPNTCSDCSSCSEKNTYLLSIGYIHNKDTNNYEKPIPIIKQPCSKCGKETFNKPHSIIETEIVCSECEPLREPEEQQDSEEILNSDIEQQIKEYQEQLDAEENRIEEELETITPIPEELC